MPYFAAYMTTTGQITKSGQVPNLATVPLVSGESIVEAEVTSDAQYVDNGAVTDRPKAPSVTVVDNSFSFSEALPSGAVLRLSDRDRDGVFSQDISIGSETVFQFESIGESRLVDVFVDLPFPYESFTFVADVSTKDDVTGATMITADLGAFKDLVVAEITERWELNYQISRCRLSSSFVEDVVLERRREIFQRSAAGTLTQSDIGWIEQEKDSSASNTEHIVRIGGLLAYESWLLQTVHKNIRDAVESAAAATTTEEVRFMRFVSPSNFTNQVFTQRPEAF